MKPGFATAISLAMALALVATGGFAQAAPVANSRVTPSLVQNSTDTGLDERLARDWGLRPEEWARYRQLMQGPLGIYSPNLDPLTALGIEARSDEERNRYAELQVQAESRRVGKTLSINAAGLVRYLYGIPFALILLGGYQLLFPAPFPVLGRLFLPFCLAGGLARWTVA